MDDFLLSLCHLLLTLFFLKKTSSFLGLRSAREAQNVREINCVPFATSKINSSGGFWNSVSGFFRVGSVTPKENDGVLDVRAVVGNGARAEDLLVLFTTRLSMISGGVCFVFPSPPLD